MKKFLSILFSFFILLSMMHFTIATHECHGKIVAYKASFSGGLASCGMKSTSDKNDLTQKFSRTPCCDDHVSALTVDDNYAPSSYDFKPFVPRDLHLFANPIPNSIQPLVTYNLFYLNGSPPGYSMVSDVSLPVICVFII